VCEQVSECVSVNVNIRVNETACVRMYLRFIDVDVVGAVHRNLRSSFAPVSFCNCS